MIFLTHLLGGVLALVYLGDFFGIGSNAGGSEKVVLIMVSALFALAPDIDTVKSKPGKLLQPFSTVASFLFRHRGFLHSTIAATMVYFTVHYLVSAAIAAAAAIGYTSHLLLDALTKDGITPLLPLSRRKLRGFIRTGGLLEKAVQAIMVILLLFKLG
ncbi:MAG TPA: metal-dependent hydrolase, partial [Candidatus Nanoarchaeia archaeon]|nr:metal-dependent hydrolase [Candidatus Nanoarchaeia archaeon]